MKNLPVKQERFCLEYAKNGNATEAFKKAGYKYGTDASARSGASGLLKKANIKNRLKELAEQYESEAIADICEMQKILTDIIRGNAEEEVLMNQMIGDGFSEIVRLKRKAQIKDRLVAIEKLAKMQGGYDVNVNVKGAIPIVIAGDEELED